MWQQVLVPYCFLLMILHEMDMPQFSHCSVGDGHVGCSHLAALRDNAAVDIRVQGLGLLLKK